MHINFILLLAGFVEKSNSSYAVWLRFVVYFRKEAMVTGQSVFIMKHDFILVCFHSFGRISDLTWHPGEITARTYDLAIFPRSQPSCARVRAPSNDACFQLAPTNAVIFVRFGIASRSKPLPPTLVDFLSPLVALCPVILELFLLHSPAFSAPPLFLHSKLNVLCCLLHYGHSGPIHFGSCVGGFAEKALSGIFSQRKGWSHEECRISSDQECTNWPCSAPEVWWLNPSDRFVAVWFEIYTNPVS